MKADFVDAFWALADAEAWADVDAAVTTAAAVVGKPVTSCTGTRSPRRSRRPSAT